MSDPAAAPPILIHRVIARLNVGGPAMHVVNLTRALGHGVWQTRLVAGSVPETEGDMSYYARQRGVEVTLLPEMSREISALDDLRTLWALFRLFRRERPTVVHTHTAKAGTLGRLAALLAGVPVRIHTFHGHVLGGAYFPPWKTRIFLEIERQLARASSRVVVLTHRQAHEMAEELRVAPRAKFAVVPLGLELDAFASVDRSPQARARRREALGIPVHARTVGIVGRLVPVKNHELYLHALAEARRTAPSHLPPLVGVVAGAGEREEELKALAARLGLKDGVLWLGWRSDLPALYEALDAVALTSHDEGTPVAILEAVSAGVPVVVRDVGGVGEVLGAVGVGTLLPREAGPGAWAAALASAVDKTVPSEARTQVVEAFSVARLADDLAALYTDEILKASARP